MRTRSILPAVALAPLLTASLVLGSEGERSEDPIGDAVGASPDIVAVTVSEPEGAPTLRFDVEFAAEPPFRTDATTPMDVVFISIATDPAEPPTVALAMGEEVDYAIGTHGATLPDFLETGGHLFESGEHGDLWWHVVDVASEGPTLSFTLDRKLIGDPSTVAWAVLVGVEGDRVEEDESATQDEQYDTHPEVGQPFAVYVLQKPWR